MSSSCQAGNRSPQSPVICFASFHRANAALPSISWQKAHRVDGRVSGQSGTQHGKSYAEPVTRDAKVRASRHCGRGQGSCASGRPGLAS